MKKFSFARLPALRFGAGTFLHSLEEILGRLDVSRVALVTGHGSFRNSPFHELLNGFLAGRDIAVDEFSFAGEPSPEFVDSTAQQLRSDRPDALIAIGGGSVMDAGKAVAAMTVSDGSVVEYLEGVGDKAPPGAKIPMIAVPTTAGTGSEATKNAVISRVGEGGFKKSLRHENYVPDFAVIDPELAVSCPSSVTAASGLDAVTQLLEAYVSTNSSPMTDSLAESGLEAAGRSFLSAFRNGRDVGARSGMAYAAYLSGVCLANAGLGVVHGVASPLGALFDVPHGVVCGTLLASSVEMTIAKLVEQGESGSEALSKYAEAGRLLSGKDAHDTRMNADALIRVLDAWTLETGIQRLGEYGVTENDAIRIAAKTGLKNHPVRLSAEEVTDLIRERI